MRGFERVLAFAPMLPALGGEDGGDALHPKPLELLAAAVANLHRAKDAAYGPAWKKRGELVSIVANIARKVDRLEYMQLAGSHGTPDESLLDTAIDLYVYAVKYLTYFADMDDNYRRATLPTHLTPPYSDGYAAFEYLHSQLSQQQPTAESIDMAIQVALETFQRLEVGLRRSHLNEGVAERRHVAEELAAAAWTLAGLVALDDPAALEQLIRQYGVAREA